MTDSTWNGLAARLAGARARSDEIFSLVSPAALFERPIAERHRLVFYMGHLEAFDWNLLGLSAAGAPAFAPGLDQLFAFGIDPVDGDLPVDAPGDWPALDEMTGYRTRARGGVDRLLARGAIADARLLHVAIEHRLMHAETLAYLLHGMPYEHKAAPRTASAVRPAFRPTEARLVPIPEGIASLGMPDEKPGSFGWDNEYGASRRRVPSFAIQSHKVTNGQFLSFVQGGGYRETSLWRPEDWQWVRKAGVAHPHFWAWRGTEWYYRGMFSEQPLPLDWPVYVSHAEASAFARWSGMSLPSEEQFHRAAYGTPDGAERLYPWGDQPPESRGPARGNFDFRRWEPTPVGAHPAGDSAFGVADLVGNGWEWTSTVFAPLDGFRPFEFYRGYSAGFFDGRHFVMKGGSARTAACMLRRSFRNWFQPHYPYVYASFRCMTQ